MSSKHTKDKIYDNIPMFSKDGKLMCYITRSKSEFYIREKLAEITLGGIRLLIDTNGPGHMDDEYYLQPRENKCVVCGKEGDLTTHHVVPLRYRSEMGKLIRGMGHDILPVCWSCHEEYNYYSDEFTKYLSEKYDVPIQGNMQKANRDEYHISGLIFQLQRADIDIPDNRKDEMLAKVLNYFQVGSTKEINFEQILRLSKSRIRPKYNPEYKSHGKLLVEKFKDNEIELMIMWRKHFVEYAKPKFLPPLWDVNKPIRIE